MTNTEIYKQIEQGLQDQGSFIYLNSEPFEYDIVFNRIVNRVVEYPFQSAIDKKKNYPEFENVQITLDSLRKLKKINTILTLSQTSHSVDLPEDYLFLIADRTIGVRTNYSLTNVTGTTLEVGQYYVIKGSRSIKYNTITYTTGSIFLTVTGVTTFTYLGSGTERVCKLKKVTFLNVLTQNDEVYSLETMVYTKSGEESLTSIIHANKIKIFHPTEIVPVEVVLDYIRIPTKLDYTLDDPDDEYAEFPENVLLTIIDLVVIRLLERNQSQRFISSSQEKEIT